MSLSSEFLEKAEAGELVIGIVGLGYVGLPLAEAYVRRNTRVIGYDISQERAGQLNAGQSGMKHIADSRVRDMLHGKLFRATASSSCWSSRPIPEQPKKSCGPYWSNPARPRRWRAWPSALRSACSIRFSWWCRPLRY